MSKFADRLQSNLDAIKTHTWLGKEYSNLSLLALLNAADGRYSDPLRLGRAYSQVYSQHSEDGVLAEIFHRIGIRYRVFLEIGIEDGRECTTRLLLEQGWHGIWIEGDSEKAERARMLFRRYIQSGALKIVSAMVTTSNINELLDDAGAPPLFDLVSIDVDQNTSHIWRVLNRRSRVVCVEYNASLPPSYPIEVPYDPIAVWDGSNWFGAGLKALELIGLNKEMYLVGCDPIGVNAYFVAASDVGRKFRKPFTAENHYESPKYNLITKIGHGPSQQAREWVTIERYDKLTSATKRSWFRRLLGW
ncbi:MULTISPECIES: hypothetical protein [unclassified Beijerinckia]|uniref:hypothetical protein n=1 Tax=unclassified Beijerinckia TaxID=2638183 RepID=UPI000898D5ED|nr:MULTISPECIES: hypothetical protein [unclassified Beijerinckia]MDH7797981.1 hypothetical protein [Beijerinckia sp. GAS462]SED04851.1 hypothetical protein SAMN05443249_4272 [Beijerinckia sp. 28-YEA-48]